VAVDAQCGAACGCSVSRVPAGNVGGKRRLEAAHRKERRCGKAGRHRSHRGPRERRKS